MATLHTVVRISFLRMPVGWHDLRLLEYPLGRQCVKSFDSSSSQFYSGQKDRTCGEKKLHQNLPGTWR